MWKLPSSDTVDTWDDTRVMSGWCELVTNHPIKFPTTTVEHVIRSINQSTQFNRSSATASAPCQDRVLRSTLHEYRPNQSPLDWLKRYPRANWGRSGPFLFANCKCNTSISTTARRVMIRNTPGINESACWCLVLPFPALKWTHTV